MRTACRRTLQDECYFMSTVGECESNPAFMRVTCAASCGFCDEEAEVSTTGVAVGVHGEASESTDPSALPSASIVLVRSGLRLAVSVVPHDDVFLARLDWMSPLLFLLCFNVPVSV